MEPNVFKEKKNNLSPFGSLARMVNRGGFFCTSAFINFLAPPCCANCGRFVAEQAGVCADCWSQIQFIEWPFCEITGIPFTTNSGPGTISPEAIANPPPFGRLRSAVLYNDIARSLISRFKFSDRVDIAPFIASAMQRAGRELIEDAHFIIPLPLHWQRLHARRFNQSAELAKLISRQLNIPWEPMILVRTRNTKQQIGLTREIRRNNVSGAFMVRNRMREELKGKRVLLVDDVYTSGASVKSATKVLLRGGAENVDVLTFARVYLGDMSLYVYREGLSCPVKR